MEGATVAEQLVGAARSNNESILEEAFKGKSPDEISKLINETTDPVGNGLLHLAAGNGSLEVLDLLLDQEGVEIDPRNRLQRNTPLHAAVEFAIGDEQSGTEIVDLLIEAGADPSPRNASNKRPIDIAQAAASVPIVEILRGAQYAADIEREAAAVGDGPRDGEDGVVSEDDGSSDAE